MPDDPKRTSQGLEIIRNSPTPKCQFCGEPTHYGVCEEMRAERKRLSSQRLPVPNPHVRHG